MCGIAGIVSFDGSVPVRPGTLAACSRAIAHRGPDAERIWLSHPDDPRRALETEVVGTASRSPSVGLAFRRLSVLDPDPRAMQPMHSRDGRFTLVFNGEIYNFCGLRDELLRLDSDPFVTTGDSEVLLRAWQIWGVETLSKLNGMFAFAIWDARDACLWLARDRLGQKPLYVELLVDHDRSGQAGHQAPLRAASFASEPRGVARLERDPSAGELDDLALRDYLRYGYSPRSMLGDLRQLEPGTWWRLAASGLSSGRYFDATWGEGIDRSRTRVSAAEVRGAVMRAVERQLVSDVPLGVFLSGGIDSSIVARCAREFGGVRTFSIGFDEPRYDESAYAEEVARHLGAAHETMRLTPRVVEDLPRLVAAFGEPFADSSMIPTHELCRVTRDRVTVALSGDGGDELFGGYERYLAMAHARKLDAFAMVAGLGRWMSRGHPKSKWARGGRFLASAGKSPAERYDGWMRIFDEPTLEGLLATQDQQGMNARDRWPRIRSLFQSVMQQSGRDVVESAAAVDRVSYLPGDLLAKVDRCSMLHGLEVRSPFMDHELVALAAGLDERQLIGGGGKRMLREAFGGDLPASVFRRRKMGFAVPIGEWFRGEMRGYLRDHVLSGDGLIGQRMKKRVVEQMVDEHETGYRDHAQRLYALLILEMWWKQQTKKPRPSVYDKMA